MVNKMTKITTIEAIMKKYLLVLTIIALIAGTITGYYIAPTIKQHKELLKYVIIILAISTLYPSMIKLRLEKIGRALRDTKSLLTAILLTLLIAPALSMLIANYLPDPTVRLGYVAANIVPASSASVGYVLLAEGSIELATSLVFISILSSLFVGPLYLEYYGSLEMVKIPVSKIAVSMLIALITPLVLGQITRYYLIRKKQVGERRIGSYLSFITMTCMLSLIFLLIMSKAPIIVNKPNIAATIIFGQASIILVVLCTLWIITRILGIKYGEHTAIAFISISKNESAATIISAVALGGAATVAPAIIPAIQPVLCILYLHVLARIRNMRTY